eukprot:s256_g25.t1
MGCGASSTSVKVAPSRDCRESRPASKTNASSWYAVAPDDIPDHVSLAPDRRDHMRHLGKLNRFLRKIQLDPDELLDKVQRLNGTLLTCCQQPIAWGLSEILSLHGSLILRRICRGTWLFQVAQFHVC